MKKKELIALREKKTPELVKMVRDLKKKMTMDYMKVQVAQEKNLKVVKNQKRDFAQIMSVLANAKRQGDTK